MHAPTERAVRGGWPGMVVGLPTSVFARLRLLDMLIVAAPMTILTYHLARLNDAPVTYSDSGTALSVSLRLAQGDASPLWFTQSPPLQDGVYAIMLFTRTSSLVHLPVLVASLLLAALVGVVAARVAGHAAVFGLTTIFFLFAPVFWIQAANLPFYSVFALLGYAGVLVSMRYVSAPRARLRVAVAAGLLLGLSLYAYTLGLVFLLVPALFACCFWSRSVLRRTTQVYVFAGVFVTPFVVWHLAVGGVSYFQYHPLDWFTIKYQGIVHPIFWGNGQDLDLPAYARLSMQVLVDRVLASWVFVLVGPGLVYVWQRFGARGFVFCVSCIVLQVALLLIARPAAHPRYYYSLLPLLVFLSAMGIEWMACGGGRLVRTLSHARLDVRPSYLVAACTLCLGASAVFGVRTGFRAAETQYVEDIQTNVLYTDLRAVAAAIDGSDGGVIARDSSIQSLLPRNEVYTHFFLTEKEYVTYLSWPSDEAVIQILNQHNIRWVLIRNDPLRWEAAYNIWLQTAYGLVPRHYEMVARSDRFEEVFAGQAYQLYRLRTEDGSSAASRPCC